MTCPICGANIEITEFEDGTALIRRDCLCESIDSERIWCFEYQERCKASDKCKFLEDAFCRLYDTPIDSDSGRNEE